MKHIAKNLIGQILNESVRVCVGQAIADFRNSIEEKLKDTINRVKEEQAE